EYWPTLSLGYQNASIRGTGADNKYYTGSDRFSSFQMGINIPLSGKAIRHQIKAFKLREEMAKNRLEASKHEKEYTFDSTLSRYKTGLSQMKRFEESILPGLSALQTVNQASYESGQINFMDYVLLMNQSFDIRLQYLDIHFETQTERVFLSYFLTK